MANTIRGRSGSGKTSIGKVTSSAFSIGDLLLRDISTGKVQAASAMTDQGTAAKNQILAAHLFAGVSEMQTLAADTADVLVDASPLREFVFPCTSETHEVGDYLGIANNAGNTALEPATLVKVASRARAIAVVSRRDSSAATTVYCRLLRSVFWGSSLGGVEMQSAVATSTAITAATITTFSTGTIYIDGSTLKQGDIIRIAAAGIVGTATGSETVLITVVVGTEIVATTGAVDPTSADIFRLEVDCVVRTAGASGVLACHGTTALGTGGTVTAKAFAGTGVNEDISSSALAVLVKCTNSSTGESVTLESFSVEIIRA